MRKTRIFVAVLVSAFSVQSALCDGTTPQLSVVSEESIRTASARLYSEILIRACLNGWRYSRSQIEKGFKRHAAEMKIQLVEQGYSIMSDGATSPSPDSLSTSLVAIPARSEREFGCFRRYWLYD